MKFTIIEVEVYIILLFTVWQRDVSSRSFYLPSCKEITVPQCKSLPYNKTLLPNSLSHTTQFYVWISFQQYIPLIHTNCSTQLVFFLCAMSLPICVNKSQSPFGTPHPVLPCRSVCEAVKQECLPTLRRFNETWPQEQEFNCSLLPDFKKSICISPSSFVKL